MRITIKLSALEALGTSVRLMLVYDRKPNGANATITDMLFQDEMRAPYNTVGQSKGRFQFLGDRIVSFDSEQAHWNDKFYMKKNLPVIYNGNAETVADVMKGNFLIVARADGNAAVINVDYSFMFKYTDN